MVVDPSGGADTSNWQWRNELRGAALRRLGQVTLALLEQPELWVHRRVERIYFKDHKTARHQIGVDFTLPGNSPSVGSFEGHEVYAAPLFLFSKDHPQPLKDDDDNPITLAAYSNIDLVDQTGQRLSLLTRRQADRVAVRVLLEAANKAAPDEIDNELAETIGEIATSDSTYYAPVLARFMDNQDEVYRKLQEDNTFRELAYILARHSLVVCLFTKGLPERSIIKLLYDEQISVGYSSGGFMSPRLYYSQARSRFSRWYQQVLRGLGWKSELYLMGLPEIGASASYHVEIDVPKELEMNEVGLIGVKYDASWKALSLIQRQQRTWHIRQIGHSSQGNIYISRPPGRRTGYVWIKLRVRKTDFLVGALVASLIISVVLGLVAIQAKKVIEAENSDAAVALLLLLPTLLAAYVARPREHEITMRMLRWARTALVLDGALPFFAAFSLLTIQNHCELEKIWSILALCSIIFVLLFIASNALPRPHGKSRYKVE